MTMLQQINATTNTAGLPVFTGPATCYHVHAWNEAERVAALAAVCCTGARFAAITPHNGGYYIRIDATPAQAAYIRRACGEA